MAYWSSYSAPCAVTNGAQVKYRSDSLVLVTLPACMLYMLACVQAEAEHKSKSGFSYEKARPVMLRPI